MNEKDLIQTMKDCGWIETDDGIVNPNIEGIGPYGTWEDAIIACIEVGSGC